MKLLAATLLFTFVEFVHSARLIEFHQHSPPPNHLIVTMKDGSTYIGELKTFDVRLVPSWLQRGQGRPTDFQYFTRFDHHHYASTLVPFHQVRAYDPAEHKPSEVEIRVGDHRELYSQDFLVYNVSKHNHRSVSSTDPGDMPLDIRIYLSVPGPDGDVYSAVFWVAPPWGTPWQHLDQ